MRAFAPWLLPGEYPLTIDITPFIKPKSLFSFSCSYMSRPWLFTRSGVFPFTFDDAKGALVMLPTY